MAHGDSGNWTRPTPAASYWPSIGPQVNRATLRPAAPAVDSRPLAGWQAGLGRDLVHGGAGDDDLRGLAGRVRFLFDGTDRRFRFEDGKDKRIRT